MWVRVPVSQGNTSAIMTVLNFSGSSKGGVRRLLEPHEALAGCCDLLEILLCQDGGDVPVIAPKQKGYRYVEGPVAIAQIELRRLTLKRCQGKAIALPKLDEVEQAGFIRAQRRLTNSTTSSRSRRNWAMVMESGEMSEWYERPVPRCSQYTITKCCSRAAL